MEDDTIIATIIGVVVAILIISTSIASIFGHIEDGKTDRIREEYKVKQLELQILQYKAEVEK